MSDTPVAGPGPVSQSASPALDTKFGRGPGLAIEDRFARAVNLDDKVGRSPAPEDKLARSGGVFDEKPILASASASPHSPYSPRLKSAVPERSKSMLEKKRVISVERRNSTGNFDALVSEIVHRCM